MNTLLTFWLYGCALIFVAYWSVALSHLRRRRILPRDLVKCAGISVLVVLLWPYFLARWLWMLFSGDLTRDVILDPLDNVPVESAEKPDKKS